MTSKPEQPSASETLDQLAATPDLAEALASERFKHFLDHVPVAIMVSELDGENAERIVYANRETEELLGVAQGSLEGADWIGLDARIACDEGGVSVALSTEAQIFRATISPTAEADVEGRRVEVNSALVTDGDDRARFRLVALIDVSGWDAAERADFEARLRDKDMLLREIQHRVKNNLQIIAALIRMEARRAGQQIGQGPFERLSGRIEAMGLLYSQLEIADGEGAVDIGALLSLVAGSVIRAQAIDGVKLDLQVEPCLTSIDVAMPVSLLVNELMTNALKYAFVGRSEGVVRVRCLKDGDDVCVVSVEDDGVGMAPGKVWPQPGKLGSLMVRSLEDNTKASVHVSPSADGGVSTTIRFHLARHPRIKRD